MLADLCQSRRVCLRVDDDNSQESRAAPRLGPIGSKSNRSAIWLSREPQHEQPKVRHRIYPMSQISEKSFNFSGPCSRSVAERPSKRDPISVQPQDFEGFPQAGAPPAQLTIIPACKWDKSAADRRKSGSQEPESSAIYRLSAGLSAFILDTTATRSGSIAFGFAP